MTALLAAVLVVLNGCAFLYRETRSTAELNQTVDALAADIAHMDVPQNLVFFGIRASDGKQTPETTVVDRLLIETLSDAGFLLGSSEGSAAGPWPTQGLLPPLDNDHQGASHLLGGRLYTDERWSYLRLALVERRTGAMQLADLQRISTKALERLARASSQGEQQDAPLEIELHILGLRRELGFADQVEVGEGAVLKKGDELQIRFRVGVECDIFAFLLGPSGNTWPIFKRSVFGGRSRYRTYESLWFRLGDTNPKTQTYGGSLGHNATEKGDFTLYFAAAARLEDGEEMYFAIDEYLNNRSGEIQDWSFVDRSVEQHLFAGDDKEAKWIQGEAPRGESERFQLADGTVLENRSEQLSGTPGVFRVLRFSVQ